MASNQHRTLRGLLSLFPLLIAASAVAQIGPHTDGFEGTALDPRWVVVQQSGGIAPSTAQSYSGRQSACFTTTSSSQNKNVSLSLTSAQPTYGRVSVRVLDTGAGVASSNYIVLQVRNSATGDFADIFTFDYDLGPGNGGVYYYRPWNKSLQPISSGIVRSRAWHLWEIDSTPTGFSIRIDGRPFATSSKPLPLDSITLSLSGPSWRPAFTAYFDDFSFVPHVQAMAAHADGFEASTLDPRWGVVQQSGSVAPSTAQSYSGKQSASFTTTSSSQNKNVSLSLTSAQPTYGRVSVRVLDTGAGVASSNYIVLQVRNSATGDFADILTFDYDLGPGNGGVYYYRPWNKSQPPISSGIVRSRAWHLWEIDSTPTGFSIRIDGRPFATSSKPLPLDSITLSLSGPSWRPAFTAYFDNFTFMPVVGSGCSSGIAPVLMATPLALGATTQFTMDSAKPNAAVLLGLAPGGPSATALGSCMFQPALSGLVFLSAGSTSMSGAWMQALVVPPVRSLLGTDATAQAVIIGGNGPILGVADLSTGLHMSLNF